MEEEKFCVRSDKHPKFLNNYLAELLQEQSLCDVTLSNKSYSFKAHKLVLSLCSPYFKNVLKDIPPCQHVVIFLNNVTAEEVSCLLEYIYTGKTLVRGPLMTKFLETCESLDILGFSRVENTDDSSDSTPNNSPHIFGTNDCDLPRGNSTPVLQRAQSCSKRNLGPSDKFFSINSRANQLNKARTLKKGNKRITQQHQKGHISTNNKESETPPELQIQKSNNNTNIFNSPPRSPESRIFSIEEQHIGDTPDKSTNSNSVALLSHHESIICISEDDNGAKANSAASNVAIASEQDAFLKSLDLVSKSPTSHRPTDNDSDSSEVIVRRQTRFFRTCKYSNIINASDNSTSSDDSLTLESNVQSEKRKQLKVILRRLGRPRKIRKVMKEK